MSEAAITRPASVLAVGAHPDDIEFMAGGTLASWAAAGSHITYLVLTDGAAGSRDPSMSHQRLIELRQQEQRAAAAVAGARDVIFLGHADGRLVATLDLRLQIARVIRQLRPDAVITHDPTQRWSANFGYVNHPDHIAAGDATLAAIMPTANTLLAAPELLAEGLEPHDVTTVLLASWHHANAYAALTEADLVRKLSALRAHVSQLGEFKEGEERMRQWLGGAAERAREQGVACDLAEAFVRITLRQPDPRQQEDRADSPEAAEAAVEEVAAATT